MAWHFDLDWNQTSYMILLNGEDARCWIKSAEPEILHDLPLILVPPLSRAQSISIQENKLIEPDLKLPQGTVALRRWGSTIYLENGFFLMFNMGRLSWSEDDINIKMERWWKK